MAKPRIAIVGAGLGGITAGLMLQRAGVPVQLYEQAPAIARLGAGIHLGPNAMRAMAHFGLASRMYEIGLVPRRHLSREWDTGRILFDVPVQAWAERFGMPGLIMHRGDLQAVLAGALRPGSVQFGKHLAGLEPAAGATLRLRFADGSRAEADVVIGADGVDSRVREALFGVEPPVYTGVVAYRAIYPTSLLDAPLSADSTKWWSDERLPAREDRHFITYHLTGSRDEVYFVTGSPDPEWDPGIASVPATIDEIRACYEGFHPEVMRVIDACPQATKWPFLIRPPLERWSDGAAGLLGDACHPMKPHMGQGANMAVEDGVVLARCLLASDGDPAAAFASYRAARFERTTRVQTESYGNTWMKYETDPGWVFDYDPLSVPLAPGRVQPAVDHEEVV